MYFYAIFSNLLYFLPSHIKCTKFWEGKITDYIIKVRGSQAMIMNDYKGGEGKLSCFHQPSTKEKCAFEFVSLHCWKMNHGVVKVEFFYVGI